MPDPEVTMVDVAVRDELLSMTPVDPQRLTEISAPGVYAWWGSLQYPAGFPAVDATLPLYVGIAARQTLGERARRNHLGSTRKSGLRRSLAAMLADELDLREAVVARPKGKFLLDAAAEARLTDWMGSHLQVTWVTAPDPEEWERAIIGELLPVLNHDYAAGSPYRRIVAGLRADLRAGAGQIDAGE
ncbi:GIY-YIG nuclease family protein [Agromyces bauzanensis]